MSSLPPYREGSAALLWSVGIGLIVAVVLSSIYLLRPTGAPPRSYRVPNQHAEQAAIPSPEPQTLEPLTPQQAEARNEAIPFVANAIEHASAFLGETGVNTSDYTSALDCLTSAVYYEAGSESEQGQRAVAQVVLNRVRHPAFPTTICGVVYQGSDRTSGCQFSFTCDGSLARRPSISGWARSRRISQQALAGAVEPSVGMSTHYHASWVVPYWASHLDKIARVGGHIFYRWPGYWGRRSAFSRRYNGEELDSSQLSSVALTLRGEIIGLPDTESLGLQVPLAGSLVSQQQPLIGDTLAQGALADAKEVTPLADWNPSRLVADDQGRPTRPTEQKGMAESQQVNATLNAPN